MSMKPSDLIDIAAVSTAPVAAWVAIGQAIHKPWAHSGFIILWGVSAGAWVIKTLIRAKKKNARRQPKRSSEKDRKMKKNPNNSISEKRRKSNSMLKEYFRENTPWLREGKGFANRYEKRDITVQPNSRRW